MIPSHAVIRTAHSASQQRPGTWKLNRCSASPSLDPNKTPQRYVKPALPLARRTLSSADWAWRGMGCALSCPRRWDLGSAALERADSRASCPVTQEKRRLERLVEASTLVLECHCTLVAVEMRRWSGRVCVRKRHCCFIYGSSFVVKIHVSVSFPEDYL